MPTNNITVYADDKGEMTLTPTGAIKYGRGAVVSTETKAKIAALPPTKPKVEVATEGGETSVELPPVHELTRNRIEDKDQYAARIAQEKADAAKASKTTKKSETAADAEPVLDVVTDDSTAVVADPAATQETVAGDAQALAPSETK